MQAQSDIAPPAPPSSRAITWALSIAALVLTLTLFCARTTSADLVTLGVWSPTAAAHDDQGRFFDGRSWDCDTCGVAWQLQPGTEYLHADNNRGRAVPFFWSGWSGGTDLGGLSDYRGEHRFTYDGWEFLLDNGHGFTARSGDGTNVLLVRFVSPGTVRYWLWFEDLPVGATDADFQDRGLTWLENVALRPPDFFPEEPVDPAPVPEPGTWLLLASGMAIGGRWLRRQHAPDAAAADNAAPHPAADIRL